LGFGLLAKTLRGQLVVEGVEYDGKVLAFVVCSANAMATWNQQPIPRHHCLARTRSCGHNRYPVQGTCNSCKMCLMNQYLVALKL